MIPPRSEDWDFKLAEQGLDLVKAPTEEEIENGPIMNHEANFIVEANDNFDNIEQSWDKSVEQNPRTEIHTKSLLSDLDKMGDDPENHPVMKMVMGKLLEVATHHDLGLVDSDQAKHVIRHARKHGRLVENLLDHIQQATIAKAFHSTAKELLTPEDEKGWAKILDKSITDGCAAWHEMHHQLHHDCKKNCGYWGIPRGGDCTFCQHGCPFCDQDDPGRFASIKISEGLAGSNDQLYLDPMHTGGPDSNTNPSIRPTPLTEQPLENQEKISSWVVQADQMSDSTPQLPPPPSTPPSVSSTQGYVQMDTSTGQAEEIAPPPGQVQQHTPSVQQLQQQDAPNTPASQTPTTTSPSKPKSNSGGINLMQDIETAIPIALTTLALL